MRGKVIVFAASLLTLMHLIGCTQSRAANGTFVGSPGSSKLADPPLSPTRQYRL
jgi:hypothetical protein